MNTSPSMPAAESAGDPRHDVVPGFPPVPITIWRTPYQQGDTYPYPSALAQRIVATFSRLGETVADLTGGLLAAACAASGRAHHLAGPQAATLPEASLVVVDWAAVSASPGHSDAGIAAVLQAARRALHPGGHLVVLTPATAGAGTGPAARHLVAGCLGTGLTYLQNIIALRADITNGRMVAHPLDLAAGTADTAVKVHADLFVFTAQATGEAA